jgi:hypothetical protein
VEREGGERGGFQKGVLCFGSPRLSKNRTEPGLRR